MTTLDQLLVRIDGDNRGLKTALQQSSAATAATSKTMASSMKQADAAIKSVDASVRKMDASMKAAGKNVVAFDRQLATASRTSGSMGVAIQQAGFQVGDFATQVASGQGVLRPFIQQGTQLVSMFGPWGAVIGAAGAAIGALATAMLDGDDAADELADSLEIVRKVQDELNGVLEDGIDLSRQDIAVKLRQAEAADSLARSEVRLLETQIEQRRQQIETLRGMSAAEARQAGIEGPGAVAGFLESGLEDVIDRLEEYQVELDSSELAVKALRDALAETTTETQDYNAELDNQIRLAGMAERARFAETKVLEAQAAAQKEGRALTESEVEAIRAKAEALYDLTDAQKANTKATKEAESEAKKLERQRDRLREAARDAIADLERENRVLEVRIRLGDDAADALDRELRLREALGPEYERNAEALNRELAERKLLTEELERQEEAQKKLADAAKKAAREMEREIERATDSIVDALSDVLFEGENIFDSLADLGKAAFREIAREAIIRPIVQPIVGGAAGGGSAGGITVPGFSGGTISAGGGGGIGGILSGGGGIFDIFSGGGLTAPSGFASDFIFSGLGQSLGFSSLGAGGMGPAAPTALGSAFGRLSSPAGMIGGFAGNFLGNALFGSDRGVGASIGSSVGAIAGSFIPIPGVGSFIGSLAGNFLGGLFGGDIGKPRGHTNLSLSNGRVSVGASGADNGFDPSGTQQEVAQLAQVLNAFADQLDLQIVGTTGAPAISGGDAPGPQSVQAALDGFFANAGSNLRSDSDAVNRALAQSTDMDSLATAIANINSAEDAIEALANALNASKDPIDQIRAQFEDLRATAVQYGLDVATIDRAIQTEIDTYNTAQREIEAQRSLSIEAAVLQQTGSALGAIQSFQLNRQLSSSATPLDRVAAAQEAVQASLEAVRGGDVNAVGGLLQNANTLLRVGADAFGTATPQFAALERMVDSQVANAADLVGNEQALQDRISAAIEAQANAATTQTEITAQMRDEIEGMRSDIRSLKAALMDRAA